MSFMPLTTVGLLTNVPLDNSYTDTLTFANAATQAAFFQSKIKPGAAWSNLTYQREEMFIRVEAVRDAISDCNYLMYQNSAFDNKWYYAFITRLEYKGESLTDVYFEIDAYQTYMFDITIGQCYVEREHTNNDTIGANTIDEGLDTGPFIIESAQPLYFDDWWIIAALTVDVRDPGENKYPVTPGEYYAGVYSGLKYFAFDSIPSVGAMLDALQTFGQSDALINMFMLPKKIVSTAQRDFQELITTPRAAGDMTIPANETTINGYTPKNNKLFTYPYHFINISNLSGLDATLRYELFMPGYYRVKYQGSLSPDGRILIWPEHYAGLADNYDEAITLGNFPQCNWTTNVYANWVAQQQPAYAMALTAAGLQTIAGVASGNAAMAGAGIVAGATTIANDYVATQQHDIIPPQSKGHVGAENVNIALGIYGVLIKEMSIRYEYAEIIDNYFSRFGYRINKLKRPNITGRQSWNYVKTDNAKVYGKCPVQYIDTIKAMLNRGVTFWHGDFVGDYSRSNNITG